MAMRITDVKFEVPLPRMPAAIELFELKAPSREERARTIDVLRKRFELGEVQTAELPGFMVLAGKRGDIQYFPASGGVIARDASREEAFESEERKWEGLTRVQEGDETIYRLKPESEKKLAAQAMSIVEEAGLVSREMTGAVVELDQWAEMDEKGQVRRSGAGSATVRTGYSIGGLPVAGAGAKTVVYAEPEGAGARATGLFHVWRTPGAARKMEMPGVEEAIASGLLVDREMSVFQKQGRQISISRLELCYLALPAFMEQGTLFPAFQVEGMASAPPTTSGERMQPVFFAKFVQAATTKHYAKVGVFAHYLIQPAAERASAAVR